jgi:hypothetical protein
MEHGKNVIPHLEQCFTSVAFGPSHNSIYTEVYFPFTQNTCFMLELFKFANHSLSTVISYLEKVLCYHIGVSFVCNITRLIPGVALWDLIKHIYVKQETDDAYTLIFVTSSHDRIIFRRQDYTLKFRHTKQSEQTL